MRTLNAISLAITAFALTVVCALTPTLVNLVLSVALLGIFGALTLLINEHKIAYGLIGVASVAAYAAGSAVGRVALGLGELPAVMLGLLATAAVFTVVWRLKKRVRRVYAHELLILSNKVGPGSEIVTGPTYVLPLDKKILAEMPRYRQEHELTIRRVNTRSKESPLGSVTQNIDHVEVELVYKLDDEHPFKCLNIHNRDLIFGEVAAELGTTYPAAMRNKQFWVESWKRALFDIAERTVRNEIHRSGLTAFQVSELREQIGAVVLKELRKEAAEYGLIVEECNLLQVEPDEAQAALHGREALLQALARAEEIKLTGEAQAGARAAQVNAMVEAVKAAGGQVPQRIVELIVHGVLPHTVLSAYVPASVPGDTLIDLQPRPGGRPGSAFRN